VNGVKARGGSINSMGPAIAGGMLYITSGYSGNAMPGNALLAFSVVGMSRYARDAATSRVTFAPEQRGW